MVTCPACHKAFEKTAGGSIPYTCPHCQSKVLGVYCNLRLIGCGAMGDVFEAHRPDMGNRVVAIKIPKTVEPQVRSRFEREIAASARLRHENIVCAFDRGEEEGRPYLVMEFVAGRALSDVVESEYPLSAARVAGILRQVAQGLSHAAGQRIVNRDIKPDNILMATADGTAKILDYGLATIAELDSTSDRVTRNGTLLGTPGFLAPEQARDPHSVSIAADVYALGCTAYFMFARRSPFAAKDSLDMLRQHAEAPRPSVRTVRPDVEPELDALIQRMMSVRPEDRPSPRELVRLLDDMLPRLSDARPSLASTKGSGLMDVRCPGCGTTYHLQADMAGKRTKCRNKLCNERFTVQPQLGATQEFPGRNGSPPPPAMEFAPPPVVSAMSGREAADEDLPVLPAISLVPGRPASVSPAADAELMEAEPLEAEPLEAEPLEAEAFEPEPFDAEPLVAEPVEPVVLEAAIAEPPPLASPEPEIELLPAEAVISPATRLPRQPPDQIETVRVSAGSTETPPEELLPTLPASAITRPAPAAAPPEPTAEPEAAPAGPKVSLGAYKPAKKKKAKPEAKPAKAVGRRDKRSRTTTWLVAMAVSLLLAAGITLLVTNPFSKVLTPQERWEQVQEIYLERKWNRAEKEFVKFQEEFPENEHTPEVPYFLAMCAAGENIFSDTGSCEQGLADAQKIFSEHRDNPAYLAYCSDLYMAMARLIERFSDQAGKTVSLEKIAGARQSLELLKTVSEAMKEEWVPSRTQELEQQIAKAEAAVRFTLARREVLEQLQKLQTPEPLPNVDDLYAKVDGLLSVYPKLADPKEKEIAALRQSAYLAEAKRVRYVPVALDEATPAAAPSAQSEAAATTLAIVWDGRQQAAVTADFAGQPQVTMALSRGVLYVFDAQGNFLWSRRLGIDSHRLPGRVEATATSPAALIAVSTEDNSLLALEAATGRVLWQYQVGGDIAAPLSIVTLDGGPNAPDKQRGLLPTADGEIHALELVLGKQLGRYQLGQPMSAVGGAYDPGTGLMYFPADSKRVFAINPLAIDDPQAPACKSVLLTEHASGALRSEPAVVGPYLIMPEASELAGMRLRAFRLSASGFADPRSPPLKQLSLAGWSWFPPRSTPDRITLVTDEGDLGVFGLNLDNIEETIYRIVEGPSTKLPVKDYFRSLAVHADEHLLWVMAGGTLRKLSLDVLHQEIRPIWPNESEPAQVTGIPLHEAQMDRWGNVFYLNTMSTDGGHFDFCAVDSNTGEKLWHRQLGVRLFGDPLVVGDRVVLVDHSGRTVQLEPASNQTHYEPAGFTQLPEGAEAGALLKFRDHAGGVWLGVPLEDRRKLAIARLDAPQSGAVNWQTISLPEELQGRPCLAGGHLLVPGADGHLYRVALDSTAAQPVNEVPFRWTRDDNPGIDTAELYPLSENEVLIADGRRRVRRLALRMQNQVTRWEEVGSPFESPVPLVGDVLFDSSRAFVGDESGQLHSFDPANPGLGARTWNLGGRLTGEPFLRQGALLAVVDDRRLVCLTADRPADAAEATWKSDPFKGRIRGQPVLAGDVLLVADDSRRVTGLRLSDGKPLWSTRLPVRSGPAAAAVPFGEDRLLVPLTDGTLLVVPEPPAPKELAEFQP